MARQGLKTPIIDTENPGLPIRVIHHLEMSRVFSASCLPEAFQPLVGSSSRRAYAPRVWQIRILHWKYPHILLDSQSASEIIIHNPHSATASVLRIRS